MARPYQPKYYPQPKTGTGFIWTIPTTGQSCDCRGVEWCLDFRDSRGKRQRRKVHTGHCTCLPRRKGVCPHEQLAVEALAAVISNPAPVEEVLEKAGLDLFIERFAAEPLCSARCHSSRTRAQQSGSALANQMQIGQVIEERVGYWRGDQGEQQRERLPADDDAADGAVGCGA